MQSSSIVVPVQRAGECDRVCTGASTSDHTQQRIVSGKSDESDSSRKRARDSDRSLLGSPLHRSDDAITSSGKRARVEGEQEEECDEAAERSLSTPKLLVLRPARRNGYGGLLPRDDHASPAIRIVEVLRGSRHIRTFTRDESPLRGDTGTPYEREPFDRHAPAAALGRGRGAPPYVRQERRPPQPLQYHEPSWLSHWPGTSASANRDAYMLRFPDHAWAFASAAAPAVGAASTLVRRPQYYPHPPPAYPATWPVHRQVNAVAATSADDSWQSCATSQRRRSRSPTRNDSTRSSDRGRQSKGRRGNERDYDGIGRARGRSSSSRRDWGGERGSKGYDNNTRSGSTHQSSGHPYSHRRERRSAPSPLSQQSPSMACGPQSVFEVKTFSKAASIRSREADRDRQGEQEGEIEDRTLASSRRAIKQRERYRSPPRQPGNVMLKEEGEVAEEGASSSGDSVAATNAKTVDIDCQDSSACAIADVHRSDRAVAPDADDVDSLKEYEECEDDDWVIPAAV